jgi:hypothetical protein
MPPTTPAISEKDGDPSKENVVLQRNMVAFLLTYLASESCEVAHAASKVILFGPDDTYDGKYPRSQLTLEAEYNDLLAIVEMLRECGFELRRIPSLIDAKKVKVLRMMEFARDKGTGLIAPGSVKELL